MFERLRRNFVEKNYGPVALELIVVIVGILIAFQIDRWADDRRERQQEYEYLIRLKEDLQFEIDGMSVAHEYAQSRIDAAMLLEKIIADSSVAREQPNNVPWALETVSWRSFPQIDAFVYSELQNSGNLAVIESVSLRRELANHYTTIHHYSRVGLDLDVQRQFVLLTAGILSTSEIRAIEEDEWREASFKVSVERAVEIANSLSNRRDASDLIPNIVQHHVFNQKVIGLARDQALKIIDQLELIIDNFDG